MQIHIAWFRNTLLVCKQHGKLFGHQKSNPYALLCGVESLNNKLLLFKLKKITQRLWKALDLALFISLLSRTAWHYARECSRRTEVRPERH